MEAFDSTVRRTPDALPPFSRTDEQAKVRVFIVLLSAPQAIIYFELAGARAVALALSLT